MKSFSGFARLLIAGLFCSSTLLFSNITQAQTAQQVYLLESAGTPSESDVTAYLREGKNHDSYLLKVNNPSGKKLKVVFYAGGTRYAYRSSVKSFVKLFDFKGAADGAYKFEVWDGRNAIKRNLEIKTYYATMREVRVIPLSRDVQLATPKMVKR